MIPRLPNDPAPAPAPDSSSPDRPRRIAAPALAGLAALVLAGCGGGGDGSAEAPQAQALAARAATAATTATTATAAGTQRYIVVLRSHVTDPRTRSTDLMRGRGGEVRHVYGARGRGLRGFAVTVPDGGAESFLAALERHPDVDRIEPDVAVRASQAVQAAAPWGLDRADQRDLPLSGSYAYARTGAGVTAYVIDSGILAGHADFGGRVRAGYTSVADGNGTSDCNGHGTHVAGIVGGATWGMAKEVGLVPVRVLDCAGSGTASGVIAGIDWVVANAARPAVINLSLGGPASAALDAAVAAAVQAGIPVVVAAGNDGADACTASPARAPAALTVGATAATDARASYSNWGACLDLFAPGSAIVSAWPTATTATATLSGTSMAAPHVAGLAALALAGSPSATPAQVADLIRAAATAGRVTDAGTGSPNLLVHTALGTVTTPAPAPTRTVAVAALTGAGALQKRGWQANATVTVRDTAGLAVAGAVVRGDYTVGGTGLGCTTGATGQCRIASGTLNTRTTSTVFSVTGITGTGLGYEAARNAVASVTVRKP